MEKPFTNTDLEKHNACGTSFIRFVTANFGPLLVFGLVNHFYGLKPAIISSTLFAIAESIFKFWKKEMFTTLFKYSTAVTLIFGAIDLYSQQTLFFKYEATITNVITGLLFGASLFKKKNLLQEFREARETVIWTQDKTAYMKLLTLIWTFYFFIKAAVYFWMSSRYSIEESLIARSIVGSVSFYALLFISISGSKWIFPFLKSKGLLPSV